MSDMCTVLGERYIFAFQFGESHNKICLKLDLYISKKMINCVQDAGRKAMGQESKIPFN